jgi:hypothetical protein
MVRWSRRLFVALMIVAVSVPLTGPADAGTPRTLSIADVTVQESLTTANFEVRLSRKARRAVLVDFSTVSGTAASNVDYIPQSGQLRFRRGETKRVVAITVNEDAVEENTETFNVVLTNAVRANIADGSALGTILDDDP